DKLGTSLVKNVTSNGEFALRTQRLLGESRLSRDSLLLDSFYDDDELFDYDGDHKSKRDVKDRHHRHRHSQRHKHRHSHRHSTSRSKREEKKNEDDVLSLSQFNIDEDDDEKVEENVLSRLRSNDYDDVINLTNARRSNSRHRISSMDIDLRPGHEDDLIVKRRKGSSGVTRKADSYGDKKIHDTLSSLDDYRDYQWRGRRPRKRGSGSTAAKVLGAMGALALSHHFMGFFLTTSNVVTLPLAASACVLGGILYKKNKDKNKYRRHPGRSITY
ncbi:hypothetical protein PCYB_115520, partial [Plasmodium cynomolgi strain B]